MLTDRKITAFTKKIADLPDRPGGTVPAAEIKAQFDSSPEELRVAHNGAMDDLTSTTEGASGAHQIGSAPIGGLTGANVHAQLTELKSQINEASTGAIPDGSIAPIKMVSLGKGSGFHADTVPGYGVGSNTVLITDANTLPAVGGTGFYSTNGSTLNLPLSVDGSLIHTGRDGRPSQLFMAHNTTAVYYRGFTSTGWKPWARLLNQADYDTLFSSVDSGKTDIKTAIIGKGGTVAGTSPHSFAELVAGVNLLGNIKTQQRGTITLNSTISGTATISAINPANAIVELTWYADVVPADQVCPAGEITNDTTLTFNKNSTSAVSTVIEWVVTEFYNVKAKQTGTANVNATSVTATVSAVNPAKCKLYASFTTSSVTQGNYTMNYTLTNSTTITFKQYAATPKSTKWQLIEFN